MRVQRWVVVVTVVMALLALAALAIPQILWYQDLASRRSLYDDFPVFPGASVADEQVYTRSETRFPIGGRGLTVTYRLPDDVSATEVIAFYRAGAPPGWTEATDEACREMEELRAQTPPPATTSRQPSETPAAPPTTAGAGVLLARESRITFFVPGGDGVTADGVTLTLTRRRDERYVVLDDTYLECGDAAPDLAAIAFDAE